MSDIHTSKSSSLEEGFEGFNPNLRTQYDHQPEIIVLDDCTVLDYILDRKRRSHSTNSEDRAIGDVFTESATEVEQILEKQGPDIKRPWIDEGYRSMARRVDDSIESDVIDRRLAKVEEETGYLETWNIEPRVGFREVEGVEHHDKVIVEFAYRHGALIATYDDDIIKFPVNYTTPGMLI